MKISIERSGGFAGMTTSYEADVDTLSAEERAVVNELVSAAEFFALPSSIITPNDTSADRFSYRITIESADGTHTVETNDASVPDSLMPLIEWVSEQGRSARGN